MIRVFFLIRSLEIGGAERQLIEITRGLDKRRFAIAVASFYDGGAFAPEIAAIPGVRLIGLGKKTRWGAFPFLANLWRAVKDFRPDVLFGDMSPANELGWALARLVGAKAVWAIRASDVNFSYYGWLPAFLHDLGARLSGFPDLIIANSEAGRRSHEESGYSTERMIVIHNGIDTKAYRPDPEAGARVREEWRVGSDETLVGIAARLDPMKDHGNFLRAGSILARGRPRMRLVCVGRGPEAYARQLRELGESLGVGVLWAGARNDMPAVYNAMDLLCCSSDSGEGFPNSVAEAMACGVPAVTTDVGDLSILVGETGFLVAPGDPEALAAGMRAMLERLGSDREGTRRSARERIVSHFDVSRLAQKTSAALEAVVGDRV
jgi:glycosyltransferase involved in cell wall biosynthesis